MVHNYAHCISASDFLDIKMSSRSLQDMLNESHASKKCGAYYTSTEQIVSAKSGRTVCLGYTGLSAAEQIHLYR